MFSIPVVSMTWLPRLRAFSEGSLDHDINRIKVSMDQLHGDVDLGMGEGEVLAASHQPPVHLLQLSVGRVIPSRGGGGDGLVRLTCGEHFCQTVKCRLRLWSTPRWPWAPPCHPGCRSCRRRWRRRRGGGGGGRRRGRTDQCRSRWRWTARWTRQ